MTFAPVEQRNLLLSRPNSVKIVKKNTILHSSVLLGGPQIRLTVLSPEKLIVQCYQCLKKSVALFNIKNHVKPYQTKPKRTKSFSNIGVVPSHMMPNQTITTKCRHIHGLSTKINHTKPNYTKPSKTIPNQTKSHKSIQYQTLQNKVQTCPFCADISIGAGI